VAFEWLRAQISFRTLEAGQQYQIGAVKVALIEQNHSHKSYGYKFTDAAGKSVVYSTDSEHKIEAMDAEDAFVAFFGLCDLVICDTMYSLADSISMKEDWGHSSNLVAIDLCHQARARRLALFHHEPTYSDADIQRMHEESIRYEELTREQAPLDVICAYDGLTVEV
jgi:ribonuclease BN (tRNA processing enzyme)